MEKIQLLEGYWHWAPSGFLIGIVMALLIWFGKDFGLSATYRTYCSILQGGKLSSFLNIDWKAQLWNIVFVLGIISGSFFTYYFSAEPSAADISVETIDYLRNAGLMIPKAGPSTLLPEELFAWKEVHIKQIMVLLLGGILVGFGTQWAGGCTSGHFISGLSNLQLPSLIAIVGFFIGGILTSRFLLPLIL